METLPSPRSLVGRLGGHPAGRLGLELGDEGGRAGWLVAATLVTPRSGESGETAFRALDAAGLARPAALAQCSPERLARVLADATRSQAERDSALLIRLSRALAERHDGSLEHLAGQAADLAELGEALVRLAPGFGAASALRFLRPLRSCWSAAQEVPLDPDARVAALHLGWIPDGADQEGAPAALLAALRIDPAAPPLHEVEAALAQLGRSACRRDRPDRCPLRDACPQRLASSRAAPSDRADE